MIPKSLIHGFLGMAALLVIYFSVVSLISGWLFAVGQFSRFWYFIVTLALGFGIQVGLYSRLRGLVKNRYYGGGRVLGITAATSTAAMISCCAHYLANVLPILGTIGVVTIVAQYQVELFWVGLLFNLGGIFYILNKVTKLSARGAPPAERIRIRFCEKQTP